MSFASAQLIDLKVLWRNVSNSRGTRAPKSQGLDDFLLGLSDRTRIRLNDTLLRCRKGAELPSDIGAVSWASACTHEMIPTKVREAGIECGAVELFETGMSLIDSGMDPVIFVMGLKDKPEYVEKLTSMLPIPLRKAIPATSFQPQGSLNRAEATDDHGAPDITVATDAMDMDFFEASASSTPQGVADSTREPTQEPVGVRAATHGSEEPWVSVRLFGKTAAHTLEISTHRRAGQFLGINVVSVESAKPQVGGGYDWNNKLSIQLTPEEMPEVIAVLLGIVGEATFSNHGSDRNKAVTFRNQPDGILIVTSLRNDAYPVPVKRAVTYYLLDLFCRAMAASTPDRKPSEVISLVRGIYS